jgi:hypothetical protein
MNYFGTPTFFFENIIPYHGSYRELTFMKLWKYSPIKKFANSNWTVSYPEVHFKYIPHL